MLTLAIKSPCHRCPTKTLPPPSLNDGAVKNRAYYPYCAPTCKAVNSYLISIGDKPHPPGEKDLHKKYPPDRKALDMYVLDKQPLQSELERFRAAIISYIKRTGATYAIVAKEVGCPASRIGDLLKGTRCSRMGKHNIERFRVWVKNQGENNEPRDY